MKWVLFFILILYVSVLSSQTPNWQLSAIDPAINIKGIELDTLGFLWIHDLHSLYRFDGAEAAQKFQLDGESITEMFSHANYFVLGTSTGRLISFNPYSNVVDPIKEMKDSFPITAMYFNDINNYLTVSYGNGVDVTSQGKTVHYEYEKGLISNEVYDITYYNEQYYLATDQGIQILNLEKKSSELMVLTTKDGLSDLVTTNLEVSQGLVWYTDFDQNIGSIDKQNRITNYRLPASAKIHSIAENKSSVHIATDMGLFQLKDESLTRLFPTDGAKKVQLSKADSEGNLWLYSGNNGLYRGSLSFQQLVTKIGDIRAISVFQNRLLLGNEEGLFLRQDSDVIKISDDNITHLTASSDYLLVGTFSEGIKVYDQKLKLISNLDEWSNIKDQSVLHIYLNSGLVFISSLSGVTKFAFTDGILTPLNSLHSIIGSGYIYSMVAKDDELYLGTDRNGLIVWEMAGDKIQEYSTFEDGEKIGSVYSLTFDKSGDLWFTSSKHGIGKLNNKAAFKLETYQSKSDEYTSITALSDGNILGVRSHSIDIIDPDNFHIMEFDRELGLKKGQAFLNTITQGEKEHYFVHDQSLFTYIPATITKTRPGVSIDEVLVNLAEIRGRTKLAQNENNIEINYAGSWLKAPSKLLYQYKLKGFDEEWRITKDRSVAYPKLSPGTYEFNVRTSENRYFDQNSSAVYSFEIKRHFYNLWWVRALGVCILLILGWQFIKNREARKKEKLALEKLNIESQLINLKNQLNPHFLFNAFNTLVGLIEEDTDRSLIFVERITDFYRNMLEYGTKNLITLGKEKLILEQYIDILKARFNGQLDIQIALSHGLEDFTIPPMTLQLLVENAVKHNVVSTKNPLRIDITQNKQELVIRNEKKQLINPSQGTKTGLENISKRFELVNLPLPVIENNPAYFKVTLQLKIKE